MARDISRFRIPQRNQPNFEEYREDEALPREVAAYLERNRRRPYVMRGILAGSLIALAGLWIVLEARRKRRPMTTFLPTALPSAM